MSWGALEVKRGEVHVFPEADLVMHTLDGKRCQCIPNILTREKGDIVCHNSWDEREKEERLDSMLQKVAATQESLL